MFFIFARFVMLLDSVAEPHVDQGEPLPQEVFFLKKKKII
jgi:hypothetical protein